MRENKQTETTQYRIIDPCDRVHEVKPMVDDRAAMSWLLKIRDLRRDPFLDLQRRIGRKWVSITPPPTFSALNSR